jgi:ATP-binding protein involved in chromosome partitioning
MSDHDHAPATGHAHPHGPMMPPPAELKDVRHVVLVGSGKGGVGKSTVAFNLALGLAADGLKVGLLDGDLYGPSVPILAGLQGERLAMNEAGKILPVEKHGLKLISLGLLLKDTDAIVWRGPLLHKTMRQFFLDVEWGPLDVLVVDLPPGTGDIQLSISQLVKVSGAVVVTTPQELAFADVLRAVKMFEKLQTPVFGLVENMAFFTADDTGTTYWPFGKGRIAEHCATHGLRHLGQIPIVPGIAAASDAGTPLADDQVSGGARLYYRKLAKALGEMLKTRS